MLWEVFILLSWSFISSVRSTNSFNAAQGKPSNQSSVYLSGSTYLTADKAVDGDTDSYLLNCASTAYSSTAPWWTVDLGKDYTVTSVVITNRGYLGDRLHDFTVTITSEDYSMDTVCGHYEGAAASVATLTCEQVTWGRYVKLTKPIVHQSDILTLCEVQVMAFDRSHMLFQRKAGTPIMISIPVTMTTDLPTCAQTCKNSLGCLGINYNRGLSQCQLINTPNSDDTTVNNGWDFYVLKP